ncbi:MAG: hypothetical protein AAB726_03165 [Patescibacteria group bacterium]
MKRDIIWAFLVSVILSAVFLVLTHFGWENEWLTIVLPSGLIFAFSVIVGLINQGSTTLSQLERIFFYSLVALLASFFSALTSFADASPIFVFVLSMSLLGNASFLLDLFDNFDYERRWKMFALQMLVGAIISATVIFGPIILKMTEPVQNNSRQSYIF